ncbi:hypothetical protein BGW38_000132, partial [Lunasporangiospora selenospora]
NVPMLKPGTALTDLDGDIIMFSSDTGRLTFHRYSTSLNQWISSGSSNQQKGTPVAAIAGGIFGAIAVLVLVGFMFYRRRNRKKNNNIELEPVESTTTNTATTTA